MVLGIMKNHIILTKQVSTTPLTWNSRSKCTPRAPPCPEIALPLPHEFSLFPSLNKPFLYFFLP